MKPTIPQVLDKFVAYRKKPQNGAWGSLHVVLDDGNVGDSCVAGCIDYAISIGDVEGAQLAKILLTMSKTQRGKLSRCVYEAIQKEKVQ